MAGLRKLKGKYYIRVRVDGKEKLLPTGTGIKADAEKQLRRINRQEIEIKQKIRDEIDELKNRITISDGCDYFTKNVKSERGLKETTIKTYKLATKDFKNSVGKATYFENLTADHYTKLLVYLQDNYNSTTTNIRLRGIRAMINYLHEKGKIKNIPFKVKQIKTDQSLPKFIMPDEMDKIYEKTVHDDLRAVYRVYEVTGMRVGELKHSYLNNGFVIVKKAKNRRERIIPIPAINIPDFERAKHLNYSTSWISHSFSEACNNAGLKDKTIHALRHTFALRKLVETNNISMVKELLGHSSVKVTEVYTQFPKEFLVQIFKDQHINQDVNYKTIEA
ncbi:tyrosine-type recombinase/integrase [Methanococcoides sp. SA1]|nr:tyrosine-type recombinase/integrase [Methanococcoides sp. SA1]